MPNKLTEEFVKNKAISFGARLVGKYEGYDASVGFLCLKHNKINKTSFCSVVNNHGLKCCRSEEVSKRCRGRFKITIETAKSIALESGFELLNNTWLGTSKKYIIKCQKHNSIHEVFWNNFKKHKALKCCWLEHQIENGIKKSGPNAYNWKPQSKETDTRNTNWFYSRTWSKRVKKRDDYICQICCLKFESSDLHGHHLNSYKMDKESRMDIDEGVTICRIHHQDFHIKYGRGNNTSIQFNEFRNIYARENNLFNK